MHRRALKVIFVFSLIGIALSVYSFLHHASFIPGTFCDLSVTFNCDVVNRGVFSEILGVPVALLGIIGYAFMGLAALLRLRDPADKTLRVFSAALAFGGLGFSFYLTSIEAFVLHVWCIIFLTSQLSMLAIFAATMVSFRRAK